MARRRRQCYTGGGSIDFEIIGVKELVADLKTWQEEKIARLQQAVRDTAHDVERSAKQYAPLDTGTGIRGTIRSEFDSDGLGARVGPRASWAAYIMEVGRRPGSRMPPVEALVPWVQRHGRVASSSLKTRKTRTRQIYNSAAEIRGVAYLIARSIAKKGIKARRYMQQAAEANNAKFVQRMREALN